MVKTLYEHFVTLYDPIHKANPTLASEHALRQEEELYKKTTKQTYRVVRLSGRPYLLVLPGLPCSRQSSNASPR